MVRRPYYRCRPVDQGMLTLGVRTTSGRVFQGRYEPEETQQRPTKPQRGDMAAMATTDEGKSSKGQMHTRGQKPYSRGCTCDGGEETMFPDYRTDVYKM